MRKNNELLRDTFILIGLMAYSLTVSGCAAHLPRETVQLSGKVTRGIAEAQRANKKLIRQFANESKDRIDERLTWIWTPRFIKNFLPKTNFDKEVCKAKGLDRAVEIQEIISAINKQVLKKRKLWMGQVRTSERMMLAESEDYYDYLEGMSRTVTQNLKSVEKSQKLEESLIGKVKERVPIIDRIDEERKKLDKMMEEK